MSSRRPQRVTVIGTLHMTIGLSLILLFIVVPGAFCDFTALHNVEAQTADSALLVTQPMSLGTDEDGNLIAIDTQAKQMIAADGENGTVYYRRRVATGMPYAHVSCPVQEASLVSYARSKLIDTVSHTSAPVNGIDYMLALSQFGDVIVSDITASHDCLTLFILDGVHKIIYVASPNANAAIFLTIPSTVAPTGILLSHDENTLYLCDWGGASIYTVDVNANPRVATLLVGDGSAHPIADNNGSTPAALSGPTQMALYKADGAILFTDRNPTLNTAAIRVLQTTGPFRGNVETIAGGNGRGWQNGEHDTARFNALWDVTYSAAHDEVYASEPLAGNVRRVHDIDLHWGSCAAGKYKPDMMSGNCMPCPAGSYCPGNDHAVSCGDHRVSLPSAETAAECWCQAGTFDNGADVCATCPMGTYCEEFTNASVPCAAGSTSASGAVQATDCFCSMGFYALAGGATCAECPVSSFCREGVRESCPSFSSSVRGVAYLANCTCDPGYKKNDDGSSCVACDEDEVCSIGETIVQTSIEFQLPDSIGDIADEVDDSVLQDLFVQALNLTTVNDNDVEIIIRLIQDNRRRLLNQQYEIIIRMRVGGATPAEIDELVQETQQLLVDDSIMTDILSEAAENITITSNDLQLLPQTLAVAYSAAPAVTTCDTEGAVVQSSQCVCEQGYTGFPNDCTKCPPGYYKNSVGLGACVSCGPYASTPALGATQRSECVCDAGYEWDDDANECTAGPTTNTLVIALAVGGGVLLVVIIVVVLVLIRQARAKVVRGGVNQQQPQAGGLAMGYQRANVSGNVSGNVLQGTRLQIAATPQPMPGPENVVGGVAIPSTQLRFPMPRAAPASLAVHANMGPPTNAYPPTGWLPTLATPLGNGGRPKVR